MKKKCTNGVIRYYQQMYAASFASPDCKVVIPTFPEIITRQEGSTKNDCERNAAKRYFESFRREHPHLKELKPPAYLVIATRRICSAVIPFAPPSLSS
ncbi:hypothetical protein [Desulfocastanea catecholica]